MIFIIFLLLVIHMPYLNKFSVQLAPSFNHISIRFCNKISLIVNYGLINWIKSPSFIGLFINLIINNSNKLKSYFHHRRNKENNHFFVNIKVVSLFLPVMD